MFTCDERPAAPLHIRSAFARARVKSARICQSIESPGMPPVNENRIET
jgi:hypothetical protein